MSQRTAEEIIKHIEENLPHWRKLFPDESSKLPISREDLLELIDYIYFLKGEAKSLRLKEQQNEDSSR